MGGWGPFGAQRSPVNREPGAIQSGQSSHRVVRRREGRQGQKYFKFLCEVMKRFSILDVVGCIGSLIKCLRTLSLTILISLVVRCGARTRCRIAGVRWALVPHTCSQSAPSTRTRSTSTWCCTPVRSCRTTTRPSPRRRCCKSLTANAEIAVD